MSQKTVAERIRAAWRVSTPLVWINTRDPIRSIREIKELMDPEKGGNGKTRPNLLKWDVAAGFAYINEGGKQTIAKCKISPASGIDDSRGNPIKAMNAIRKIADAGGQAENNIVFIYMANRWLHGNTDRSAMFCQSVWNLRDEFKAHRNMLVLLGPDSGELPAELRDDVMVFDQPLPNHTELSEIVAETFKSSPLGECKDGDVIQRSVAAIQGLGAFQAEQVAAMSLTPEGMDFDSLWERKRKLIEDTPGLAVYRGQETFADVRGCDNIKTYLHQVINSRTRPNLIVFIDEIEKVGGLSGATGDQHSVDKDTLGTILRWMQDYAAKGMLLLGVPGGAKTAICKATCNEAKIPMVMLDLGGLKDQYVGNSEQNLRNALKVISAMSDDRTLWMATCNAIHSLPKELRRRFKRGTFFFDLPTAEERSAIWDLYLKKYDIKETAKKNPRPADCNWTGAEIEQCVETAWDHNVTLQEAAQFVTPVYVAAQEEIDQLRAEASNRYISASYSGLFDADLKPDMEVPQKRKVRFED